MLSCCYALVGGAHQRHTVVVVCVCVCVCVCVSFREILFAFSPQSLNIKDWNVQCKLNAMLSWNRIGEFWIKDSIVELWRDLLTLMAVASSSESSEEQIPHNRLLINMIVQSVQQIWWRPEWNPENETAKATQPNQGRIKPRSGERACNSRIAKYFLKLEVTPTLLSTLRKKGSWLMTKQPSCLRQSLLPYAVFCF